MPGFLIRSTLFQRHSIGSRSVRYLCILCFILSILYFVFQIKYYVFCICISLHTFSAPLNWVSQHSLSFYFVLFILYFTLSIMYFVHYWLSPIKCRGPPEGPRHLAWCFYLIVRLRHRARCLGPFGGSRHLIEQRNVSNLLKGNLLLIWQSSSFLDNICLLFRQHSSSFLDNSCLLF